MQNHNDARSDDNLLTEEQAAAILGVKPETLCSWRHTKKVEIPFCRIGRAVRYHPKELWAFIDANTYRPA